MLNLIRSSLKVDRVNLKGQTVKMLMMNVLVKPMTKEQLGKIVLPSTVEDEWHRGKVISLGPKVDGDIKVGDIIVYPPAPPHMGGQYPTVGNEKYIIIPEPIIWAVDNGV